MSIFIFSPARESRIGGNPRAACSLLSSSYYKIGFSIKYDIKSAGQDPSQKNTKITPVDDHISGGYFCIARIFALTKAKECSAVV